MDQTKWRLKERERGGECHLYGTMALPSVTESANGPKSGCDREYKDACGHWCRMSSLARLGAELIEVFE